MPHHRPKDPGNLTVSVKLSPEEREILERQAEQNGGASMSSIIRKLIRQLAEAQKAA